MSRREALPLQSEIAALDCELRGGKNEKRQVMSYSRRKQHSVCLCEKIPVKTASDLRDELKELSITCISISLFK